MAFTETIGKGSIISSAKALMKAAVIGKPKTIEIQDVPMPAPSGNEIRIRLEGTGVCASNIPVWEGREWFSYPVSPGEPGHEGYGVIDAIGEEARGFQIGDRVSCLSYHAYATHDMIPDNHAVRIPDQLNDIPFPGEPLGCAMNIFRRSEILPGQIVAVVGSGFLGALLIQLCKSAGADVIAISRRDYSLETAVRCGAGHAVRMVDHWKIIEDVKKITGGKFCDRTIEATGSEWPLNIAIEITGERGRLIVAGFHQDGMRSINMQTLNWRGIDMINAHERDYREYIGGMQAAIEAIMEKRMDPTFLYTHFFELEDLDQAFLHMVERPEGFIKAIIKF